MQYMLKKGDKASSFARGLQVRHAGVCNEGYRRGSPDPTISNQQPPTARRS